MLHWRLGQLSSRSRFIRDLDSVGFVSYRFSVRFIIAFLCCLLHFLGPRFIIGVFSFTDTYLFIFLLLASSSFFLADILALFAFTIPRSPFIIPQFAFIVACIFAF